MRASLHLVVHIMWTSDRYTEALAMFKGLPDPLWNASVLEGLATVPILEAWANGAGLVIQYLPPITGLSWKHLRRMVQLTPSRIPG